MANGTLTIPAAQLAELIESIVQILEEVLGLDRREPLSCHVTAVLQLLLQAIHRADRSILARVDAGVVAPGAVGVMQALAFGAVSGQRRAGTRYQRDSHEERRRRVSRGSFRQADASGSASLRSRASISRSLRTPLSFLQTAFCERGLLALPWRILHFHLDGPGSPEAEQGEA